MAVWTLSQFFFSLASCGSAGGGEGVDFDAAAVLGFAPLSGDPALFSETMQGGKERSRADDEYPVRHLLDAVGDADAVERAKFQGAENEEIEGSLQEFRRLAPCREYIDSRYRVSITALRSRNVVFSAMNTRTGLRQVRSGE